MARDPVLTVAIPTCNGSGHLVEAIRGIQGQTFLDFDFLICDDRSDDDTVALARAGAGDRARIVVNSERMGLAGNWNRCMELSRTEWVAVFHQDDVMKPDHLRSQTRVLAASEEKLGMVAGRASVIDEWSRPVDPSVVDPGGEVVVSMGIQTGDVVRFPPGSFVGSLAVSNPLRCSAVTLRKAAHAAVGGFDASYRYVVDWEFWLRIANRYEVFWRDGPPTVAVRWHVASETHRFHAGAEDLEETSRLLDVHSLPDRRRADRRLSRAYLNRAYEATRRGNRPLARLCLGRSLRLWPGIVGRIVIDPRLMAKLAFGKAR